MVMHPLCPGPQPPGPAFAKRRPPPRPPSFTRTQSTRTRGPLFRSPSDTRPLPVRPERICPVVPPPPPACPVPVLQCSSGGGGMTGTARPHDCGPHRARAGGSAARLWPRPFGWTNAPRTVTAPSSAVIDQEGWALRTAIHNNWTPPLCDIPSRCCFFTGPWTVTRSSLRMLRRVAAFCRPLRPVLPLVSFPRSRSPVVGVPGLCWMWRDVPFARQRRPVVAAPSPLVNGWSTASEDDKRQHIRILIPSASSRAFPRHITPPLNKTKPLAALKQRRPHLQNDPGEDERTAMPTPPSLPQSPCDPSPPSTNQTTLPPKTAPQTSSPRRHLPPDIPGKPQPTKTLFLLTDSLCSTRLLNK